MAQYANAVISKARAMYGQMLSPAQYDDLLRKQNVQEISAYLREKTPYRAALEGVQDSTIHRRQLENLLHRTSFTSTCGSRNMSARRTASTSTSSWTWRSS